DARFAEAAALLDHGFEALRAESVSAATRLRVAGGWAELTAEAVPVVVPADASGPTAVPPLPVEVPPDGDERAVPVVWNGHELASLRLVVDAPERPASEGGVGLGAAVVDRVYAAMRASTTTGAWRVAGAS
ncbi:MAG: hypothetical protein KY461_14485, partial [Actinobacteria bacterium]|nr:hypothetical protein [Actinomycetota bacterium]